MFNIKTHLFLGMQIANNLADVKQVAIEGGQSLTRLNVEPFQLSLRLVDGRMKQLPLGLLFVFHVFRNIFKQFKIK